MRNIQALTTPPRRLAMVAGISQYKPPQSSEEGEPGHANEHGGDRVRENST
jgi:hypothetical protein